MKVQMVLNIAIALLFLCVREHGFCKAPHIIFIFADDLGWSDVSFHGSKQIPTPNIDTLAYNGVILNNYYVQPVCSPSRGALMTGKYPIRIGLQIGPIPPDAPYGLSPTEMLLPQYLKQLGYATHGVGKWHLGFFQEDYLPTNRGFDSFFGYWTGFEDYFTHYKTTKKLVGLDFHDNTENVWNYTGYYGTEVFTERAKTIIKNHNSSNNPLFLYLPHQAVHTGNAYDPLQAPLEYSNKFSGIKDKERRKFAGMVSALDKSVGEVFTALDDAHMLENSIIIFSTDNGAPVKGMENGTGSNWPLRGSKFTLWEGGVRGAAFIWSPLLPNIKGYVSENLMHVTDWLPTLYAAAGGDVEKLPQIDGYNMWSSFCQKSFPPRDHVLLNINPLTNAEAVRKGRYKLIKASAVDGEFNGWFDKDGKKIENSSFEDEDWNFQNKVYQRELEGSEIAQYYLKKSQGHDSRAFHNTEHCCTGAYEDNVPESSHFLAQPVLVNCGLKRKDPIFNCEPTQDYCLFDIKNDPCEYNNLARILPPVVEDLKSLLETYRAQAVAPRNQPADPNADPKYHGGAWVPWVK